MENNHIRSKNKTAIINAKIFDGEKISNETHLLIEGEIIKSIGGEIPADAIIVDAFGATLLPGLIDAHVHTSVESLREALKFGITTELEMMGGFTKKGRELQLKNIDDIADVQSAGMGLTAPGGHPDELIPKGDGIPDFVLEEMARMSEEEKEAFLKAHEEQERELSDGIDVTTEEGAVAFARLQIANGADYFKVMIEEGTVMNSPNLPVIEKHIMKAAVDEAHRHRKIAIAHVLTAEAAKTAVEIGVDGLAHLFIDRPYWTPELIKMIADNNIFVTPCLVLNSSIIGNTACVIAQDERVKDKIDSKWKKTLCSCFNTFPKGNMEDNFMNVIDLHKAGVDILVGTDVSVPVPSLGGLAHGVSVHHELQLLVGAGLTPMEALQSATSKIAKRFSLSDRGRIFEGARADLLLVHGDPTQNISDTLSISKVWKNGDLQG
jgi:imidazolonepropionase-like amidohydrolase